LLFGLYWLKRQPVAEFLQAIICGFGVSYFLIFSPIANTTSTSNTIEHYELEGAEAISVADSCGISPYPGGTITGATAHFCEAICFFFTWFLFAGHGIWSGAWLQPHGPKYDIAVVVCTLVAFVVVSTAQYIVQIPVFSGSYTAWWVSHWGVCYFVIVFVQLYALVRGRRNLVLLTMLP
jgi:hypothetical protein